MPALARAGEPISPLLPGGHVPSPGADERYDREYVGLRQLTVSAGGNVRSGVFGYRGKHRVPLAPAVFFRTIDRPDLARAYESRARARAIVWAAAGAAVIAGVVVAVRVPSDATTLAGRSLIATGLLAAAVGAAIRPPPVPMDEVRAAVDAHNQRLREQLGLALAGTF